MSRFYPRNWFQQIVDKMPELQDWIKILKYTRMRSCRKYQRKVAKCRGKFKQLKKKYLDVASELRKCKEAYREKSSSSGSRQARVLDVFADCQHKG